MEMKNLILIGLPGSGKTTLGRELAISTGRQFIDLDDIIKQKDGRSVEEIFRSDGEAGFRDRETAAIREIKTQKGAVIACGGGVVLKRENVEILSSVGLIVYLDRPVEMILATVDLSDRPLLREDPCRLFQLQRERRHLYEEAADFIIGCSSEKEALLEATRISKMEETDLRLAVIGDPIAHSRSPEIHLPILQDFYNSVTYSRIQVTADRLPGFLATAGVRTVVHLIFGLPGETREDMMASVDYVAACSPFGVKFHQLYVMKGTAIAGWPEQQLRMLEKDQYISFIVDALERLPQQITVHRLTGDAPEDSLIAPLWCLDKRSVLNGIQKEFKRRGTFQGSALYSPSLPSL
jgi:shikimate kinase